MGPGTKKKYFNINCCVFFFAGGWINIRCNKEVKNIPSGKSPLCREGKEDKDCEFPDCNRCGQVRQNGWLASVLMRGCV